MNIPELRPAAGLQAYARNARTHSPAQVEQLARAIQAFGFVGAIVVRGGTVAKGHGTLQAVLTLYARGEPIYPAPGRDAGAEPFPSGTVPVLDVSGWSESQFRAYVIADNKLGEESGWDAELLSGEIDALGDDDSFDFDHFGFDFGNELAALQEDERTVDANAATTRDTAPPAAAGTPATAGDPPAEPKKATVFPVVISLNRAQYGRLQAFKGKHTMSDTDVLMRGI